MAWQPISKEELEALMNECLCDADDDVLNAWAAMRIEPMKWQCPPWGDEGGGFWVVAIRNGMVTWYNDIEDGFNESPLVREGIISEYRCNQDDFSQYLQRFPEARNELKPSVLKHPASIPSRLKGPGQVIRRQTTYWTVETGMGERWRLHFLEKAESSFTTSSYSCPQLLDTHPLLAQYVEPWLQLYFLGAPKEPDMTTSVVAAAISEVTGGWRKFEDYANPHAPLSSGYGSLMRAPQTVIRAVEIVLARHGVKTNTIKSFGPGHPYPLYRVLLLDTSYVIAEGFRFEPFEANK